MSVRPAAPSALRSSLIGSSLLGLVVLGAPGARAAVINVTSTADGGAGSLRAAFDTANGNAEADEIVLQSGATYDLTNCGGGTEENANADGDLDHAAAEAITIIGNGATIRNTCTDERVIHAVSGTGLLTLRDVTITGGAIAGAGGGVRTEGAPVTLLESIVTGNTAASGGGISTGSATVSIDGSTLSSNQTTTSSGGAIHTSGGLVTITSTAVSGNVSADDGGGIRMSVPGTLTISDSTFSGNTSGEDGGAVRSSASMFIRNTTISGNSAALTGGGIQAVADSAFNNITVTGNAAPAGEGGGIASVMDTTTLSNSIVAGNSGGDCDANGGALVSQGNNIDGDGSCGLSGPGDKPATDPKLGPLADNGGPTPTHALLEGSPAIGAGNETIARGGPACEPADQRGAPRKDCDIGAYERVVCGKAVVNRIGTSGEDVLMGTSQADGLLGLDGKDTLKGKGGKDGLCGGAGKDTLKGGGGKDLLRGEGGKDTCIGQGGKDKARACEKTKKVP
ncbi:MAG: hypothetical protein M3135_01480 [Actinomycetota bacterium]|nr:hypothetical protein [Actinomycetota bacterium]